MTWPAFAPPPLMPARSGRLREERLLARRIGRLRLGFARAPPPCQGVPDDDDAYASLLLLLLLLMMMMMMMMMPP